MAKHCKETPNDDKLDHQRKMSDILEAIAKDVRHTEYVYRINLTVLGKVNLEPLLPFRP